MNISLCFEKSTPNKHVYKNPKGFIPSLYIEKTALPDPPPQNINVSVSFDVKEKVEIKKVELKEFKNEESKRETKKRVKKSSSRASPEKKIKVTLEKNLDSIDSADLVEMSYTTTPSE